MAMLLAGREKFCPCPFGNAGGIPLVPLDRVISGPGGVYVFGLVVWGLWQPDAARPPTINTARPRPDFFPMSPSPGSRVQAARSPPAAETPGFLIRPWAVVFEAD
jgi:hypothetical protein